jgi:tetratricopeptide (TPR) repeat protein
MAIPVLDQLFVQLREARTPELIDQLQDQIWAQWLKTGDPYIDHQMEEGLAAMETDDYTTAIEAFTDVVGQRPGFFEAWNKRATAYFLRGSYKQSIADIETTLLLEPRHFGALSGLSVIYLTLGDLPRALNTSERLLSLIPYDDSTQDQVLVLRQVLAMD